MNFVPVTKKLKPKCINAHNVLEAQSLGHSAQGHITPCCFIDAYPQKRGVAQDIFYQDKFKISNVKNIKEITQSKEWVEWYLMLQQHPDQSPKVCWKVCSEDSISDEYGDDVV